MDKITTIGLDLAKHTFHLIGLNQHYKVVLKKRLPRKELLEFFNTLPACLVAMEACGGCHYFAREIQALGHQVKLLPAQHVKAYLRGNKHDYNDARAIAEAVNRPQMPCVQIKTVEQQDLQLLNEHRQGLIRQRTQLVNRIRAVCMERGVIMNKGIATVRRALSEQLAQSADSLSELCRGILHQYYEQLQALDEHIRHSDRQLAQVNRHHRGCERLGTIPGFGPVVSSYFYSYVGQGRQYRRGREVSASLGMVPRQHSSGGKTQLLGISKRGNRTLRCLLIHGARAVVSRAAGKTDPLSRWIQQLILRVGLHKATVAYANKMARIGWALLRYQRDYQPNYSPTQ